MEVFFLYFRDGGGGVKGSRGLRVSSVQALKETGLSAG